MQTAWLVERCSHVVATTRVKQLQTLSISHQCGQLLLLIDSVTWSGQPTYYLLYKGASLIRNDLPLGPYSRPMSGPYGGPRGGGLFLMSEVPL